MFRYLQDNFLVYLIDLPGMGRSSKIKGEIRSIEDVDEAFVHKIEKWRLTAGVGKVHIAGFVFGAYVATKYAYYYPENVHKLFLLSPLGVRTSDFCRNDLHVRNLGCFGRCWSRTGEG
mmetsp:Transcript_3700/g.4526  ORF Transcript_3700/g.4526 Transcript_3700/m.4526 type:complete len:118 (-) Transcript_3700:900-1253(-)